MTPLSTGADVAPRMVRGVRRSDFAARLKARLGTIRARVEDRAALIEAVRQANTTLDPHKVAAWVVHEANAWAQAPCWAVVALDANGRLVVLADAGLRPEFAPSLWAAAEWVMRHGVELFTADMSNDMRVKSGGNGTVVAFPLLCRNQTVGVLVGFDPAPSSSAPSFGRASLLLALRTLLEPPAIALDNALALQKAEALSVTDDLTRLYNSRYLDLSLRRETKRASRSGRPLSLLFIDLDNFKQVNDTYGHVAGSKLLVEVAATIRGCARETDVVGRFGGDEFSVILPDTGREGALAVAGRCRQRLSNARFLAGEGLSVGVTASIGVATLPDMAVSAEELLRAADRAMYLVKSTGKDGIRAAEEESPEPSPRSLKE